MERTRRSQLSIASMAPRTEAAIELMEVGHLGREDRSLRFGGLTRKPLTAAHHGQDRATDQPSNEVAPALHGACSWASSSPGVSRPARAAIGQVCIVSMRSERAITQPPVIPKATCEAMNQRQSIR